MAMFVCGKFRYPCVHPRMICPHWSYFVDAESIFNKCLNHSKSSGWIHTSKLRKKYTKTFAKKRLHKNKKLGLRSFSCNVDERLLAFLPEQRKPREQQKFHGCLWVVCRSIFGQFCQCLVVYRSCVTMKTLGVTKSP